MKTKVKGKWKRDLTDRSVEEPLIRGKLFYLTESMYWTGKSGIGSLELAKDEKLVCLATGRTRSRPDLVDLRKPQTYSIVYEVLVGEDIHWIPSQSLVRI